ncbi:tumor necrosis factor receptor superfamily member 9-like [Megalops cyprinoides]|uniref:tumor necrosis factor receptor superfamily member 9-like n=1 Tax=Megalops cyprinoides TaxID=118141 RepID=UPI0018655807|nr:tumor necrosis factor receptor superfamily member 9-like [Megalops cyprinoides]
MWQVLGVLLLAVGFLGSVCGVEKGCQLWESGANGNVCCTLCRPGNRQVTRCGPDPKELCVPCEDETYTDVPGVSVCQSCTQCIGLQKVKQECTSSSNTVCDCQAGYRCGGTGCSFCYEECGKGQQPLPNRTCQVCPLGTFNDKIHSKCVPWSKSCPQSNQKIVKNGTAVSDIVCTPESTENKDGIEWTVAAIVGICLCLVIIVALGLLVTHMKSKKLKMTVEEAMPQTKDGLRLVVRQEECSFCFPQQEQGSSLESVASLESKQKLLVSV